MYNLQKTVLQGHARFNPDKGWGLYFIGEIKGKKELLSENRPRG